jgi:WD40 repeat protein
MQVALRAAWREHRAAGTRLVEAYESVGGVLGALANEAEAARRRLEPDDQERLESIFVRLVRLGDTGGATRRTASLEEFDKTRRALLQRLGRDEFGRLVVVGETSAEIAHEALITQWPWLQGRLRDVALDVRRLDRLMEKAQEWREAPAERKDAYLAAGAERESFDELARQRADWLSPLDRAFVEASNRAHESEREKERRTLRIARHNESVALTALANIEAEKRPINAAKLALAAWPRGSNDTATPKLAETLDALGRIVPNLRERRVLRGHRELVTSAGFSPDGKRVAAASDDRSARVWEIATLKGHESSVCTAAFSPDGKRVVTTSTDNTARVWDAETGRELTTFKNDDRFANDNTVDNTARLTEAETVRAIVALKGHEGPVGSVAFSPDGKRVVTASADSTARLWDAETGREIATLKGHEESVNRAAFSPDGRRVVTASADSTARLWDAETGREIAVAALSGHSGSVNSAVFSPDGARVITGCEDGTARLCDATTCREIATLLGHRGSVNSAAFSPDGTSIVTASDDETARLWDATTCREIAVLLGHGGAVSSAAFGPDGTRIVTSSWDSITRVWDTASGRQLAALRVMGPHWPVLSVAFSPDGKCVLTASSDNTARIWDVSTIPKGNILQVACAYLRMHEDPVSLDGVTEYPLTFDRPICVTDPPPPDLMSSEPDGGRVNR